MVAQTSSSEKVSFDPSSCAWMLDIGVSHHMTLEVSQVPNTRPWLGHDGFLPCNGTKIPIYSVICSSFITHYHQCMLSLTDLLHTPHTTTNLLSFHRLCSNNNVLVEFHSSFFLVKDPGEVYTWGYSDKGVSKVHGAITSSRLTLCLQNEFQSILIAFKASLETWHESMGHAYFTTIQQALKQAYVLVIDSSKDWFCKFYLLAKSHKQTFVSTHVRVDKSFILLYLDIWIY